jgi:hypothetical protein
MKKVIYTLCLLLLITAFAKAQTPQQIESFAKVLYPIEWYKKQQKLWKAEIEKNKQNANAWYNYFKVSRTLVRIDKDDKRNHHEKDAELKKIVTEMEQAIPNTFEINHAKWIVSGLGNMADVKYLKQAAELQPDNPLLFADMVTVGELTQDTHQRNTYLRKWFSTGGISAGFLHYNHNVIVGLKENAILVTVGDNDTYPVWVLQNVHNIRKDVVALNTSLLLIKEYREKIFKELGVPPLAFDPFASPENDKKYKEQLIAHLAKNTKNRPVYVALTVSSQYIDAHKENLYLTGLAYQYSTTTIDNMATLKKNFEQLFALDYLDKVFYQDDSKDLVKHTNTNYIVPMVKLYEHYTLAGEPQKAQAIKTKALGIVKGTDNEEKVTNYFKK